MKQKLVAIENSGTPEHGAIAISDIIVAEIATALAEAPECEAEVTALREALERFNTATARQGGNARRDRENEASVRLTRAEMAITKLSVRAELGEFVADEMTAAKAEVEEARRLSEALAGEDQALREIVDERREDLSKAHIAVTEKLKSWRRRLADQLDAAEDEAHRTLHAIGTARWSLDMLGDRGTVPDYVGRRPKPTFVLDHEVQEAIQMAGRALRQILRV
jgi:hypothetical protein